MNASMPLPRRELAKLSARELVDQLVSMAGQNNEMDCRDALNALRDETLRRLRSGR